MSADVRSTVDDETGPGTPASIGGVPTRPGGRMGGPRGLVKTLPFYGSLVVLGFLLFQPIPRELVGGVAVLMMLVLLAMRVPVAIAMAVPGALGIFSLNGLRALESTATTVPFDSTASWSLSVLPMFIFMGILLWRSGITERMYDAGRQWLSWLPGGLAVGTNVAGGVLGAVSGSTIAVTYALGRIGVPEMLRAGYDRRLATGAVLMAGTGGQLLPPSLMSVIYAGVVAVPVGPQLLAGMVPGIILVTVFTLFIIGIAVARPAMAGAGAASDFVATWPDRWRTLKHVWPIPVLLVTILGGLYAGFFTATEAGAVGAFGAFVLTIVAKRRDGAVAAVRASLMDSVAAVGSIFFLIIGAMFLNRLLTIAGSARWLANTVTDWDLGRVQFLIAVLIVYIILGMFMDPLTILLLLVPVLLPSLEALGISLLWFGAYAVLLGEVAVITPPVGILTFVVFRLVQDPDVRGDTEISLRDVFESVLWFLPAVGVLVALMIWFPAIVEWLPNISYGP